jgi:hypothetical protein
MLHLFSKSLFVTAFFLMAIMEKSDAEIQSSSQISKSAPSNADLVIFSNMTGPKFFGKKEKDQAQAECDKNANENSMQASSFNMAKSLVVKCFYGCEEFYNNGSQATSYSYSPPSCSQIGGTINIGSNSSFSSNSSFGSSYQYSVPAAGGAVKLPDFESNASLPFNENNPYRPPVPGGGPRLPISAPEGFYANFLIKISDGTVENKAFMQKSKAKDYCIEFMGDKIKESKDVSCWGDNQLILLKTVIEVTMSSTLDENQSMIMLSYTGKESCKNLANARSLKLSFSMKSPKEQGKFFCFLEPK